MNKNHFLNLFPHVEKPNELDFNQYDYNKVEMSLDQRSFYELVFSPDPVTGNPTSDIQYMLSGSDEGFKQYIREKLMQSVPSGSLVDDVEVSEALVKRNLVTENEFLSYAREYVLNNFVNKSD